MKTGSGIPPWHLWGGTQQIDAINGGNTTASLPSSGQLAKISYKRPDTWHWLFGARILTAAASSGVGNLGAIGVYFDLTIGVGRAQFTMPAFESFVWRWDGGAAAPLNQPIYSVESLGPNRIFDTTPAPSDQKTNAIRQVEAQDIQLVARVVYGGVGGPGNVASVEVSAFFAPKTHIRPDWEMLHFMGGEQGGA